MSRAVQQRSAAAGDGGRAAWVARQKGRRAVLYVIRLTGHGETFYKVGITYCFSSRFTRLNMPYAVRTLARWSSWDAGRVWDLEQKMLALVAGDGYAPCLPFAGRTECFSSVETVLRALPADTFFLKHTKRDFQVCRND